jgi:hypothetical protein
MTSAFGDLSDDSHDRVHWVTLSDLSHDSDSVRNGTCTQAHTMASLYRVGDERPSKKSRDYETLGSPSLVEARLAQNSARREQRRLRKLSRVSPMSKMPQFEPMNASESNSTESRNGTRTHW